VTDPKRLTLPQLDLPEDYTREDLLRALGTVLLSVDANLRYLRADTQVRSAGVDVNAAAIRRLEGRVDALELAADTHRLDAVTSNVPR
jgi:hypothetical protein